MQLTMHLKTFVVQQLDMKIVDVGSGSATHWSSSIFKFLGSWAICFFSFHIENSLFFWLPVLLLSLHLHSKLFPSHTFTVSHIGFSFSSSQQMFAKVLNNAHNFTVKEKIKIQLLTQWQVADLTKKRDRIIRRENLKIFSGHKNVKICKNFFFQKASCLAYRCRSLPAMLKTTRCFSVFVDWPEAWRDGGAAARPQPDAVGVPRGQTAPVG